MQMEVKKHTYKDISLAVMQDLCADIILGHNVLQLYESVAISFGGPRSSMITILTRDCKPVATKSR